MRDLEGYAVKEVVTRRGPGEERTSKTSVFGCML